LGGEDDVVSYPLLNLYSMLYTAQLSDATNNQFKLGNSMLQQLNDAGKFVQPGKMTNPFEVMNSKAYTDFYQSARANELQNIQNRTQVAALQYLQEAANAKLKKEFERMSKTT
jgi:hypothetical protein